MNPPAIETREIRHLYSRGAAGARRPALDGISFDVRRGEFFGLLGPNGSGKTTLSRILTTSMAPSSGMARVLGLDVARDPASVRRSIGVVFQHDSLDRKLTVTENLRHQGRLYGLHGGVLEGRLGEMLARFGLADRAGERVERLSGGLRRRAELAKSLLHRPELLILDEPSAGLDPGARQELWRLLGALRSRDGVTALITTHLMEEAERCDRLAILDSGVVVALGSPSELKREVGGDVVTVRAQDAERLSAEIRDKFGVAPGVLGDTLHIEWPQGHAFIPALLEAFPGRIASVTVSQPSLEDVFIHRTKRRFWRGEPTA